MTTLKLLGFIKMNEKKLNWSSILKLIMFLIIIIVGIQLLLFILRDERGETKIIQKETIHLSALSTVIITEMEAELNKRLHDSDINFIFRSARIQWDKIYVFLDRDTWRDLSLNEKADILTEVVQICNAMPAESIGIPIELLNNKPQIYFYDRDFSKELALWSVEGSAIID